MKSSNIIRRLIDFYKLSYTNAESGMHELWEGISRVYHKTLHESLLSGDENIVRITLDTFSQSKGFHGIEYSPYFRKFSDKHADVVKLQKMGIDLSVPDCFGFKCNGKNGGVPHRLPVNCHFAILMSNINGSIPNDVLEIGVGVGWVGMFLNRWGVKSYSVLDIPSTSVLAAYFLSKCVGEHQIWLCGEPVGESDRSVRIYPSTYAQVLSSRKFDVIGTFNSFPEIGHSSQDVYLGVVEQCLSLDGAFVSVNHECDVLNQRSLSEAIKTHPKLVLSDRKHSDIIEGYIEEIYRLKH